MIVKQLSCGEMPAACDGERPRVRYDRHDLDPGSRPSRRRLLQIGGAGALGLTLRSVLRAEAQAKAAGVGATALGSLKLIRSCILLFHYGGPSHLDTLDMKPGAPAEIRGQFKWIATSASGIRVCELLPRTAAVMDRVAIIRSMHHPMTNH